MVGPDVLRVRYVTAWNLVPIPLNQDIYENGDMEGSTHLGFSLVAGGPVYRLTRLFPWVRGPQGWLVLGAFLALVTWGPLLVLSAAQGHFLRNVTIPFLADLSAHARFLVALPLLFAAEVWIDPRLAAFVRQIIDSRLVLPAEHAAFESAVRTVARLRDSWLAEAILLAAVVTSAATVNIEVEVTNNISSWREVPLDSATVLTPAGWWYTAVALPIFQFLLLRWGWRIVIWSAFLWRLSRLDLQLIPTHPDLAGGLGYLGPAQSSFSILSFAGSVPLAGLFAEKMLFAGGSLKELETPIFGIALINLVLFVAPTLVFFPQLFAARRRGRREYGVFAATYTRGFDAKWIRHETSQRSPLGTSDIQSLADLANSFWIIQRMRVVPFGRELIMIILGATLAPMLPLLTLAFPIEQLVERAVRLLFGV
jgi:hypothetical protein